MHLVGLLVTAQRTGLDSNPLSVHARPVVALTIRSRLTGADVCLQACSRACDRFVSAV